MKKTPFYTAIFALSVLFFATCCDPKTTTEQKASLTIEVAPSFGSQPFTLFTAYNYTPTQRLKLNLLKFFVSNVELVGSSNTAKILDYALVDAGGATVTFGAPKDIETGEYTKIRFGLGVDAATNAKNPNSLPSSNPLTTSGWYWSDWRSFTFLKAEGFLDTGAPNATEITYHTSRDTMYRVVELPIQLAAKAGASEKITLKLDVKKLFINNADTLNIRNTPISQAEPTLPAKTAISIKIANNFKTAWAQ